MHFDVRLHGFLVCMFVLSSCGTAEQSVSAVKKTSGLFVINVLNKALYDDCHIKGSINVPLEKLDEFVKKLNTEKAEIVVYCSNYFCTSSGYACKDLKNKGFKHVWAYEAGIAEWYQSGLPVEGPCKQSYLSKKTMPPAHQADPMVVVLSTQQLAEKLGVLK